MVYLREAQTEALTCEHFWLDQREVLNCEGSMFTELYPFVCRDCGTLRARNGRMIYKPPNTSHQLPLPIGTQHGKIEAVLWTGGERYYMLFYKGGVSLMPATLIEEGK